ncbi:MAG: hypothetical protein HFH38_02075 [Lachnospiraceae bacterium]|jgi:hypothetical protein|nr:hypothetical protein [Lachnospiraceae bacterium]
MKYRTIYRICLLAVIILTLIGGITYYVNYVERKSQFTEGTLVKGWKQEGEKDGVRYRLLENRAECAGT